MSTSKIIECVRFKYIVNSVTCILTADQPISHIREVILGFVQPYALLFCN